MTEKAVCRVCGEPMPEGEEMFSYHGYSGPCPKPPLPTPPRKPNPIAAELDKWADPSFEPPANAWGPPLRDLLKRASAEITRLDKRETT